MSYFVDPLYFAAIGKAHDVGGGIRTGGGDVASRPTHAPQAAVGAEGQITNPRVREVFPRVGRAAGIADAARSNRLRIKHLYPIV